MVIRNSFLLLAILGTGCHSSQGEWHAEHVSVHSEEFCSARLFSRTKNLRRTLEIEFIRTHSSLIAYLFIHNALLPSIKDDSHHLRLFLETKEKKESFTAYLLEGKQKCLLPSEAIDFLIDSLNNNQEVTMMVSGYKRVLSPAHFADAYQAFVHKPSWEIPFQFKLE